MIRPANDYVYVDRYKSSDFTDNGLFVPDNAKPLLKRGRVISVGPGRRGKNGRIPMQDINPGDEIVWHQAGVEKYIDEERNHHIFVEEKYILAVIR